MIRVHRPVDSKPASLDAPYGSRVKPPKIQGKSERESVVERMLEHRRRVGADPASLLKFKFPYERYGDRDVVNTLTRIFHGKCAYCESRYAGTQPMDVEHWRPKGEVHDEEGKTKALGYYWLASEWTNLMPSCIDCNRARTQFDALENKDVVLGKKNQFPVEGDRTIEHEADPGGDGGGESEFLIDPCREDPEPLLQYDEQGLILPRVEDEQDRAHQRAMTSIRVYALNRAELVADRLAVIRLVDHRFRLIRKLGMIREALRRPGRNAAAEVEGLSDVIAAELDVLLEMAGEACPHAGLVRQLLRDAAELP